MPPTAKPTSLRSRVLNTGLWTISGGTVSVALKFVSSLIVTRLLQPDLFGLMAAAATVMVGLAMFSDAGLSPSVIQSKRGDAPNFLNTAWVVQILRGICLSICGFAAGGLLSVLQDFHLVPAGSVYADPILPWVIGILSISSAIDGLQSTKLLEARRHLSIGRITHIEIATQIVGILCTVMGALLSRSIWALVAGVLGAAVTKTLLTHIYLPGTSNRWSWNRKDLAELSRFGKWIFLSSIFGFLAIQGDRLLLGAFFDPTVFGVYVIAYQLFGTLEAGITRMVGNVSFPALSEVARDRPESLRSSFYKLHAIIGAMAYFYSGLLVSSGAVIVDMLFDNRYTQAGWMLQILGVALLAAPFKTSASSLISLGLPRLFSKVVVVRAVALFFTTVVGFLWFGVPGALWGVVISYLTPVPFSLFYQFQHKLIDAPRELMLMLVWPVGIGVGALFNIVVRHLFPWVA